ncbi:MAG TPA: Crp/Fnr family transcriptional regulator, partial [Eubacteriaceae bacterium]|nr:Crp/Fnr family transcriptional regulator [Eubacteriaceae bacterium]
ILDKPMKYHVEAVEDTHICMISKKDFQEIVENHPIMTGKMMAALVERIDRLEDMVENMGAQEIEKRLIEVLVEFARSSDEEMKNNMEIVIPLSREGIANYIGSTRETVSRKLNLLKAEGLIDFVGNKKIRIKDIDLLTKR